MGLHLEVVQAVHKIKYNKIKMGYLSGSNITNTVASTFNINVSSSNHYITYSNGDGYNDIKYIPQMTIDYTGSYSNVLIAGLGLGVIPQWFATEKNSNVTVIENNNELISTIENFGYLHENINIIEADIFTYEPSSNYDIAVMDIWFDCYNSIYYQQTGSLINKYSVSSNIVSIPLRNY
tara:strand:+ start:738 stop:1274 length:537 start_codon:yes stop_codon:yes gene_type:complete